MGPITEAIKAVLMSKQLSWILGFILVSGAAVLAYSFVGWLGIGLIGIFGLYITQQLELNGEEGTSGDDFGTISVRILARRQKAQSNMSPEEKQAFDAKEQERKKTVYLINTYWFAMAILGFWMFFHP